MKVICINDRVFDIALGKYSKKKVHSITKNKVYDVLKVEMFFGMKHYWITSDSGWSNYYHIDRFIQISLPNKLKLL